MPKRIVQGVVVSQKQNKTVVVRAERRMMHPIYKKFVEAMAAKAQAIRIGPGIDRDTRMGAVVSRDHFERVRRYQEIGKREAKVAAGGGRASGGALDRGFFVEPTIFYDVDNSARIAREEIFGPVACVIPFDDEDDALRIAVKSLRAGIVWVNHMQPTCVEAPWGGYKQSGIGRELGKWGVEEYLNVKQVYINLNEQPIGWF